MCPSARYDMPQYPPKCTLARGIVPEIFDILEVSRVAPGSDEDMGYLAKPHLYQGAPGQTPSIPGGTWAHPISAIIWYLDQSTNSRMITSRCRVAWGNMRLSLWANMGLSLWANMGLSLWANMRLSLWANMGLSLCAHAASWGHAPHST